MPMPKRMPVGQRFGLAWRIIIGQFNVIQQTQTHLLEEITLRNRNKEWYANKDAGKYPWLEPETWKEDGVG